MNFVTKNQKFTDQMPTDRSQNHLWIIGEAASNSYCLPYLKTKKKKCSITQPWAARKHGVGKPPTRRCQGLRYPLDRFGLSG